MTELVAGLSIGLAAGLAPGPLQALVVTSTLRSGFGAGWRVALAPLITDVPIVALSVTVLAAVGDGWVRTLGIAGGTVVIALGVWEAVVALRATAEAAAAEPATGGGDIARGAVVNVLSPHPWLFWALAGGPLLVSAWSRSPGSAVGFVAGFYVMLVGSKVALAWVVALGRRRLDREWRRRLGVSGGVLLIAGGILLLVGVA